MSTHLSPRRQTLRWIVLACLTLLAGAVALAQPLAADAHAARTAKAARAIPRSLSLAATRSTRADRALVADAKALRRCLSWHPKRCGAERRTVQQAGSRLAWARRRLAKAARSTGRSASASRTSTLRAPKLSVSRQTLTWTRIARVGSYVIEGRVPGQAAQFAVINGTSVTPPPVPGATAAYRARTAVRGSSWSAQASIAFPAPTGTVGNPPAESTPPSETAGNPPSQTVNTQAAPALSASGQSLTWNQVGGVSTYVLMQRVAGQGEQYSAVSGTSFTPTPVPGATVYYSVRTAVNGSAWASEVSIAFPQAKSTTPSTPPVTEGSASGSTFTESFVKGFSGVDINGWGEPAVAQIGEEVHNAGAGWLRAEVNWAEIMPSPGVYRWARFDKYVHDALAQHLQVLPILTEAPSWTSPSDATAYASFVAAAVARYGPGTEANMQWFELWNEPYFPQSWSGHTPEPKAYARDVQAAALAAREVAPSVKLLLAADYQDSEQTGGTAPWQTHWIDDMFAAVPALGSLINGVAVHPYGDDPALPLAQAGGWKDASGEWAFQRIDTIRAKFQAHGVNVPFWITEEGWSTWQMSEAAQAKSYSDLIAQVAARPWIRALFSFCLRELEEHPTNNQAGFGLLKFGTWQPKPAYYALKSGFAALS